MSAPSKRTRSGSVQSSGSRRSNPGWSLNNEAQMCDWYEVYVREAKVYVCVARIRRSTIRVLRCEGL